MSCYFGIEMGLCKFEYTSLTLPGGPMDLMASILRVSGLHRSGHLAPNDHHAHFGVHRNVFERSVERDGSRQ